MVSIKEQNNKVVTFGDWIGQTQNIIKMLLSALLSPSNISILGLPSNLFFNWCCLLQLTSTYNDDEGTSLVKRGPYPYPLSREIELNLKGGSVEQMECNACIFSIDAFAKIGQAICTILTEFTLGSIQ